jgi:hypothetical protein
VKLHATRRGANANADRLQRKRQSHAHRNVQGKARQCERSEVHRSAKAKNAQEEWPALLLFGANLNMRSECTDIFTVDSHSQFLRLARL